MANTSSAKKAARKIARRAVTNGNRVSRVRSYVRKVDEALASGDKAAAEAALPARASSIRRQRRAKSHASPSALRQSAPRSSDRFAPEFSSLQNSRPGKIAGPFRLAANAATRVAARLCA
jgi:ribosomal protein S20